MAISYTANIEGLNPSLLEGFFVGWPNPPSPETFLKILAGSYKVIIAKDGEKVVGFINCISDGVLSTYIPLLEVLPEYQKRGIGKVLVERMQRELKDFYMLDLLCDEDLIPFYGKFGMQKAQGVCLRNYDRQSGK